MKAFISGVTSGIGKATAELLLFKGWEVYGCSRHPKNMKITEEFVFDVSDPLEWLLCLDKIKPLDLVVNNAGVLLIDELNVPDEILVEMVDTNLMGVYYGCLYAKKYVKPGGVVVNIASNSGIKPEPDIPLYAALKAGVIHMTKCFAKGTDKIRFVSISPGLVKTNLVPGDIPPEFLENVFGRRAAEPEEIAEIIYTVFSTPYMNGNNIVIDGGGSL